MQTKLYNKHHDCYTMNNNLLNRTFNIGKLNDYGIIYFLVIITDEQLYIYSA